MSRVGYLRFNLIILLQLSCSNADYDPKVAEGINVAILVYPGVELLDFAGPYEVFSNSEGFNVYTVASETGKLFSSKGLVFSADYHLGNSPSPDILVIPGAPLSELKELEKNMEFKEWLRQKSSTASEVMSVGSGKMVLSNLVLIAQQRLTNYSTTSGLYGGIEGALQIIRKLKGTKAASAAATILGYDPHVLEDELTTNKIKK